jgi:alpha-glucosidase
MSLWKELELKLKYIFGSLFYLKYTPYAYIYSRKRDRLEREFTFVSDEKGFDNPGKLLNAEKEENITKFYFELAELEISFLA